MFAVSGVQERTRRQSFEEWTGFILIITFKRVVVISLSIYMTTVTNFKEPLKPLKGCYNLSTEFMQGLRSYEEQLSKIN